MAVMTVAEAEEQGTGFRTVAYKALTFLQAMEPQDVAMLPPARRRQLADLCAHWAKVAEPSGVLRRLPAATD
jgi:hypothetical protein